MSCSDAIAGSEIVFLMQFAESGMVLRTMLCRGFR